jgi:hypothetical protein
MNEEQLAKMANTLDQILAELRRMNEREEMKDQKSSAVQGRFANL